MKMYHHLHFSDVMMTAVTCQITSLTCVYSTVYSGSDQRKHQRSASLAFVRGITGDVHVGIPSWSRWRNTPLVREIQMWYFWCKQTDSHWFLFSIHLFRLEFIAGNVIHETANYSVVWYFWDIYCIPHEICRRIAYWSFTPYAEVR